MKATILKALNWRYATKKYDPEFKLSAEEKSLLEESLQLTPSSFGLQLYISSGSTIQRFAKKPKLLPGTNNKLLTLLKYLYFALKTT